MKKYIAIVALAAWIGACSGAQDKQQAQGAAIGVGCSQALAIARQEGAAGDITEIETGCEAELRAWRKAPVDGGAGGGK